MEYVILALCIVSLIISLTTLILSLRKGAHSDSSEVKRIVNESLSSLSKTVSELVAEKTAGTIKEIEFNIKSLTEGYAKLRDNQNTFTSDFGKTNAQNYAMMSDKFNKEKDEIIEKLENNLRTLGKDVQEKLEEFKVQTKELNQTVDQNLKELREENNQKLDKINQSVNEKLQETLDSKLKDSFDNVVRQIGNVNAAVGEIKGLASDVSSLKNVLTNVKTKGVIGEVLLENIIEDFLAPSQYEKNAQIKLNKQERVEYAIKLPGKGEEPVLLAIDSKFPQAPYAKILESQTKEEAEKARKDLRASLLTYAKDVSEKYINPPRTTDFAIIFLPLEGLFLEAMKMGLFEEIQSAYRVNLTGPTTLTAFVNSLQLGFKSLQIEKKSSEVFQLLAAVKTEFGKFTQILEKTQTDINKAAEDLDKLVGARTRSINSKLKSVELIDEKEAQILLDSTVEETE